MKIGLFLWILPTKRNKVGLHICCFTDSWCFICRETAPMWATSTASSRMSRRSWRQPTSYLSWTLTRQSLPDSPMLTPSLSSMSRCSFHPRGHGQWTDVPFVPKDNSCIQTSGGLYVWGVIGWN